MAPKDTLRRAPAQTAPKPGLARFGIKLSPPHGRRLHNFKANRPERTSAREGEGVWGCVFVLSCGLVSGPLGFFLSTPLYLGLSRVVVLWALVGTVLWALAGAIRQLWVI